MSNDPTSPYMSTRADPSLFEAWMRRDLRARFGAVAEETVPDTLLAMLERPVEHRAAAC